MSVHQIAEEVRIGVGIATNMPPRITSVPYPHGVRVRDYQISGEKYGQRNLATSLRYHVQTIAHRWQGGSVQAGVREHQVDGVGGMIKDVWHGFAPRWCANILSKIEECNP